MNTAKDVYDKTADIYDYRHQSPTTKIMREREKKFLARVKGLVLDIGCGTGCHLRLFNDIIGLDISQEMLKKALSAGKPLVLASAEQMPFKDETFDTVLCLFSVLNLCDHKKVVHEINRVLKVKGIAVVSVASVYDKNYSYNEKKNLKIDEYAKTKKFFVNKQKIRMRLFTKDEFINIFQENGFRTESFDSLFILQKPKWNTFEGFSLVERLRLFLERFMPKEYGCVYFGIFKKSIPSR